MKNQELDVKLRAYMQSGGGQAFPLNGHRVFAKPRRGYQRMRKAPALLAAALILVISMFAIPPVRAALGSLFTFIPGVGIVEKGNETIYAVVPIAGYVEADGVRVDLDNAVYADKYLSVSILGNGNIPYDDLTLYINGETINRQDISYGRAGSSRSWECHLHLKRKPPESGDIFEIAIEGFPQRLSFMLAPCRDYQDLAAIGPTVTQNDISITVTAERAGNELRARYYPLNGTGDTIQEYGARFYDESYIVTESGFVSKQDGPQLGRSWFSFEMPESDSEAALHIPCLTMRRNDERSKRFSVDIPKDYTAAECDISLEFSLGTVRVTNVERKPNEYGGEYDDVYLSVALESKDENMIFSSFSFTHTKNRGHGWSFDEETGCMNRIMLAVKPNETTAAVVISGLEYYLPGEYVIPLDIK